MKTPAIEVDVLVRVRVTVQPDGPQTFCGFCGEPCDSAPGVVRTCCTGRDNVRLLPPRGLQLPAGVRFPTRLPGRWTR
jgi:hypothetical protein